MAPREYRFELSHDQPTMTVIASSQTQAIERMRTRVNEMKPETVVGLDCLKPKFWVKRGSVLYPISAKTASVLMH